MTSPLLLCASALTRAPASKIVVFPDWWAKDSIHRDAALGAPCDAAFGAACGASLGDKLGADVDAAFGIACGRIGSCTSVSAGW